MAGTMDSNSTTFNDFDYFDYEDYIPFYDILSFWINGVLSLALVIIGIFGNVAVVMSLHCCRAKMQPKRRRQAFYFYLMTFAFWNTGLLIATVLFNCIPVLLRRSSDLRVIADVSFLVGYPLGNCCLTANVWLAVVVTVERYLAVSLPFHSTRLTSPRRRAKTICILLSIGAIFYNLPLLFELSLNQRPIVRSMDNSVVDNYYRLGRANDSNYQTDANYFLELATPVPQLGGPDILSRSKNGGNNEGLHGLARRPHIAADPNDSSLAKSNVTTDKVAHASVTRSRRTILTMIHAIVSGASRNYLETTSTITITDEQVARPLSDKMVTPDKSMKSVSPNDKASSNQKSDTIDNNLYSWVSQPTRKPDKPTEQGSKPNHHPNSAFDTSPAPANYLLIHSNTTTQSSLVMNTTADNLLTYSTAEDDTVSGTPGYEVRMSSMRDNIYYQFVYRILANILFVSGVPFMIILFLTIKIVYLVRESDRRRQHFRLIPTKSNTATDQTICDYGDSDRSVSGQPSPRRSKSSRFSAPIIDRSGHLTQHINGSSRYSPNRPNRWSDQTVMNRRPLVHALSIDQPAIAGDQVMGTKRKRRSDVQVPAISKLTQQGNKTTNICLSEPSTYDQSDNINHLARSADCEASSSISNRDDKGNTIKQSAGEINNLNQDKTERAIMIKTMIEQTRVLNYRSTQTDRFLWSNSSSTNSIRSRRSCDLTRSMTPSPTNYRLSTRNASQNAASRSPANQSPAPPAAASSWRHAHVVLTLIAVKFLLCYSLPVVINIVEVTSDRRKFEHDQSTWSRIVAVLVDLSNLLIVVDGATNSFFYFSWWRSRLQLRSRFSSRKVIHENAGSVIAHEEEQASALIKRPENPRFGSKRKLQLADSKQLHMQQTRVSISDCKTGENRNGHRLSKDCVSSYISHTSVV